MRRFIAGLTSCRPLAGAAVALLLAVSTVAAQEHPAPAEAQSPATAQPPARPDPHAADQAHAPDADEPHEESIWPQLGKIFNFAVLAGTLFYFARKPLASYLAGRRAQVRSDLVEADAIKKAAAAQIAEMDARLAALPAELAALRARGQEEIAAEQRRIRELAEIERQRLLEAATREIDQKTRMARRELVEHAASLAVATAERKINAEITDADRARLVDRFLAEVKSHE